MGRIVDYGTLRQEIEDMAGISNSKFIADIPMFVQFAINDANRELLVGGKIEVATAPVLTSSRFLSYPDSLRSVISLKLDTDPVTVLTQYPIKKLDEAQRSGTGKPSYFADYGTEFAFDVVPDDNYTAEMTYYEKFADLDADTDTNWLITDAPAILLYGSILHGEHYLKRDKRIPTWHQRYQYLLQNVKDSEAERMGQVELYPSGGVV